MLSGCDGRRLASGEARIDELTQDWQAARKHWMRASNSSSSPTPNSSSGRARCQKADWPRWPRATPLTADATAAAKPGRTCSSMRNSSKRRRSRERCAIVTHQRPRSALTDGGRERRIVLEDTATENRAESQLKALEASFLNGTVPTSTNFGP
jgi:hypothetical protein